MVFAKNFSDCGLRKKIGKQKLIDGNILLRKDEEYSECKNISDSNIIRQLQTEKNAENKKQENN